MFSYAILMGRMPWTPLNIDIFTIVKPKQINCFDWDLASSKYETWTYLYFSVLVVLKWFLMFAGLALLLTVLIHLGASIYNVLTTDPTNENFFNTTSVDNKSETFNWS